MFCKRLRTLKPIVSLISHELRSIVLNRNNRLPVSCNSFHKLSTAETLNDETTRFDRKLM